MTTGTLDATGEKAKYIHVVIQPNDEMYITISDPSWPQDPKYALKQLGKALLEIDALEDEEVSDILEKHGIQFAPIPSDTADHKDT